MNKIIEVYGIRFEIYKEGLWKSREIQTGLLVEKSGKKSDCERLTREKIEKYGAEKLRECIASVLKHKKQTKLFNHHLFGKFFRRYFGEHPLHFRERFSHFFLGHDVLDVIEFDKFLRTPDGVSTNDHIKNKYGSNALTLVRAII